MNHRRLLLAAVAAAVPALFAPSAADAAPCVKALPGPAAWEIAADGSQSITADVQNGSNFDEGHGVVTANGVPYPMIPADEDACTTTATSIKYPPRAVGGFLVTREVTSIGGRIRRIDRFKRQAADSADLQIGFEIRVKPSQVSTETASGDTDVTSIDHWSVHENDGGSHPFLQWGTDGPTEAKAEVFSYGDVPAVWKHKAAKMPDARLTYPVLHIGGGQTVSVVHMSGTTTSAADSQAAAEDRLTPFTGLTQSQMQEVVNWGYDPDADGVNNWSDQCPAVQGNSPDGCLKFEGKIVEPKTGGGGSGGAPPALPADGPTETDPAPAAAPAPPVAARDTIAPRLTLSGMPRSAKRSLLTGRGLTPRIACDEACSVRVQVLARDRGKRRAAAILTRTARLTGASRVVRLKLAGRRLRRLAAPRLTVVVTVTDAAGNRRSATRSVAIRR